VQRFLSRVDWCAGVGVEVLQRWCRCQMQVIVIVQVIAVRSVHHVHHNKIIDRWWMVAHSDSLMLS